jgi:hypothetical protein
MKKLLRVLARTLLGVVIAVALGVAALAVAWLVRREDPTSFLPDRYVAYFQVPSLRGVYDQWLNLEAVDVVLARPELAAYGRVVNDARGLALTSVPLLRLLLDVPADVMLLKDRKLVAAVDLGWRGMATPLARIVGPMLRIKGFSFLNDGGVSMYRYTAGATTIHAALANNVAIIALDENVLREALERRTARTGLDMKVSRELLGRMKLRSRTAIRVLVDTPSLAAELLSGSPLGASVLAAVDLPDKSMLDVEMDGESLTLSARLPVTATIPELSRALGAAHAPMGVLGEVPADASLLTVCTIAPLADLYRIAAAVQGRDVKAVYEKADAGARSVVGAGIEELLFSWIGSEVGAFMLPGSREPVFFARISDEKAYQRAMEKLANSVVADKDSSLVLDGVRVDRLAIPWYVGLILDSLGVNLPDPYFISRSGFFFLSIDAANLSALAAAADTGGNLAKAERYRELSKGMRSDPALFAWYDAERSLPFFIRGTGVLAELLKMYAVGSVSIRTGPSDIQLTLAARRGAHGGVKLLPGFPVSPGGSLTGDVLAFKFQGSGRASLAWIRDRQTLVLADAAGTRTAEAAVEQDSVIVPDIQKGGAVSALWAVSPGGTVYRFNARLEPQPPFPAATGITGTMPPGLVGGRLALFSKSDARLELFAADGTRDTALSGVEAPLFAPPDARDGLMAWYPKSFDSRVHLADASGREAAGWPVQSSGISFCAPRIVANGGSPVVTFLTQAGALHAWDLSGAPLPGFPVTLPGVFYATAEPMRAEGRSVVVALSQEGSLSMVALDGTVLRQANVPDVGGKSARILAADVDGDGGQEVLLYGSGAFIAGLDAAFRALPGFPVKGAGRPQIVDMDQDGAPDFVTAGLDGAIYAYTMGRSRQ